KETFRIGNGKKTACWDRLVAVRRSGVSRKRCGIDYLPRRTVPRRADTEAPALTRSCQFENGMKQDRGIFQEPQAATEVRKIGQGIGVPHRNSDIFDLQISKNLPNLPMFQACGRCLVGKAPDIEDMSLRCVGRATDVETGDTSIARQSIDEI